MFISTGYEAVRGLMAEGAHVVIASRDQKTCDTAAAKLREQVLRVINQFGRHRVCIPMPASSLTTHVLYACWRSC